MESLVEDLESLQEAASVRVMRYGYWGDDDIVIRIGSLKWRRDGVPGGRPVECTAVWVPEGSAAYDDPPDRYSWQYLPTIGPMKAAGGGRAYLVTSDYYDLHDSDEPVMASLLSRATKARRAFMKWKREEKKYAKQAGREPLFK